MRQPYRPSQARIKAMTAAFRRERPREMVEDQRRDDRRVPRVLPERDLPSIVQAVIEDSRPTDAGCSVGGGWC